MYSKAKSIQFYEEMHDSLVTDAAERVTQKNWKAKDDGLSLIQETHQKELESIDKLTTEIKTCTVQMNRYYKPFAFLQIHTLLDAEKKKTSLFDTFSIYM